MNVLVQERVGPIGFSPIAEAYRNFGMFGIVFVLLGIGLLVGWMDRWPSNDFRNAILGVILLELLINVRNAFTATPSHLIIGLGIVMVVGGIYITLGRGVWKAEETLHRGHQEAAYMNYSDSRRT